MATLRFSALIGFAAIVCAVLFAPAAQARTFPDVAKSYWDYAAINWVTNQGPAGAKLLDDYVGMRFAPDQPISREQLAAALVTSLGRQGEQRSQSRRTDRPARKRSLLPRRASRPRPALLRSLQGQVRSSGGSDGVTG